MSALEQDAPLVLEHNRQVIEQMLATIIDRRYCVLIGPRFSGKTVLLRAMVRQLADEPTCVCVYISLDVVEKITQSAFFTALADQIFSQVQAYSDQLLPNVVVPGGLKFRLFLQNVLFALDRDLVLMIDHLEAAPSDLLSTLLTTLRSLKMEARDEGRQVIAVVAGALNLATITIGEASPFRGIAVPIPIGDLDEQQSAALLAHEMARLGLTITPDASAALLQATVGDAHLIRTLSRQCAELLQGQPRSPLNADHVGMVVQQFIREEAKRYHPLREATRIVEEELDLLECVRRLLEMSIVPRQQLPLQLAPDLDALYLTGLVRRLPEQRYQLRNEIYRAFLMQHFNLERVGHLLALAGRWEEALNLLALHVASDQDLKVALLEISINAMYAADDNRRAVYFLLYALDAVFGIQHADVWLHDARDQALILVNPSEAGSSARLPSRMLLLDRQNLEVRVYLDAYQEQAEEESGLKRVIQLRAPGRYPIGVLTLKGMDGEHQQFLDQRDRELHLIGYLKQAARALQEVNTRYEQSETLREIANIIGLPLRMSEVLSQILSQIKRVIPFDTASIQLLESDGTLKIIAAKDFRDPASVEGLVFPIDEQFPNVLVCQFKEPLRYGRVRELFPQFGDARYQVLHIQSWLGVPLLVGSEIKGVITFDNSACDIYTLDHETLAVAIATQAAVAIQRAQIFERKLAEEKLLQEIAQMTSTVDDLPATWQQILKGAMSLTHAEFGNISLVDEAHGIISNVTEVDLPGAWRGTEQLVEAQGIQSWVAANRISALIRDVNDPKWRGIYHQGREDTLSELAVPIIRSRSDQIVGIINLESPRANAFDEVDQELLEKLALQADLAVHNAQQYQAIQESAQRQEELLRRQVALLSAGQTIGQAGLEINAVLQAILDQAVEVTEATFGSLQLIEDDALVFVAAWPAERLDSVLQQIGRMPLDGPGITVRAVRESRALLIPDVNRDPGFVDGTGKTRSELAVVLKDNDRAFGVLNVEHHEPGGLDGNDHQLLIGLANLAMVALKNAAQYKELEKAKDHLFASEAVAWMGLFGADWQHSISQKISSITFYTNGLRRWLSGQHIPAKAAENVLEGLNGINEVVQSIRNVPLTNQVPEEMPNEGWSQTMLDRELEQIIKHWCDESDRVSVAFDLCCPDMAVNIPPQWLKIAMEKLINNALKAMPQRGELHVTTRIVGEFAHISIRDTGQGIPKHVRPHFLKRAIRRSVGEPGSGMGSLIARFIVRSHGGDLVLIDSREDYGTELLMTLPVAGKFQGVQ